jgi:hypothetical protein
VLQSSRINRFESEIAQSCLTLAPVPRHSRPIVDQSEAPADEPVEQRRFANVRPTNNRDGERHGKPKGQTLMAAVTASADDAQRLRGNDLYII